MDNKKGSTMTRQMQRPTQFGIGIAAAIMVFGFQNCGQFVLDPLKFGELASLGSTQSAGANLVPPTDKTDSDCRNSAAYDACIIRQNPLASGSGTLSADPATRRTQVAATALYGVKLTSLSGTGRLENPTISVQSIDGTQIAANAVNLKSVPSDTNSNFEQANVYYWMNRAAEYFDARTNGALPAKNKAIKVVVDDTITGYETKTNTIRLKKTAPLGAVAWNGDVSVHMFGIANLMLANPNGWTTLSATKHTTCNAIDKGCCATAIGCANAIRFGVGEYFAASLFPERTRIGEAIVNTGNPQIIAGVARNIASLSASTSTAAFTTSTGHTQAMGLIYASIWWQVRAAANSQSNEIDRIFLEHLTLLDGTDDFRTAIAKAKTVDARLFSGRHAAKFDAQLTARGL